ncbi:phage tail protein [Pseudomonas sp. WOUb67]|uniref:phage tail protein n=1 Tax=Pseudomonas sp. WOUb67 TaxID=3161136 RepID=UPI003CF34EE5
MSDPFIGEIKMLASNYAPRGYAMCQGQLLPIQQNNALFALVGTAYGGDGRTTFGLPHFGGRSPIGQGVAAPGVQSVYQLGESGGSETATLSQSNMPTHAHQQKASAATATTDKPGPDTFLAAAVDGGGNAVNIYGIEISSAPTTMAPQSIAPSGGSTPFAIRNPFQAVSFVIALIGEYPSRP